jgi:hypothetical protein
MMLEPEEVGFCVLCSRVAENLGRLDGVHKNKADCDSAKTLAEYVREYGQEQRGLGYEEGREEARQRGEA